MELDGSEKCDLRLLAVTHASVRGGAQEFFLEVMPLMKEHGLEISVLASAGAEQSFISDLKKLNSNTFVVSYKNRAMYPDMIVEEASELVKSSDVVWLADEAYLAAPRVKRIKNNIPIIAHLHCLAMLCPMWHKTFGEREPCRRECSLTRIIRCKQLSNESEYKSAIISKSRMRMHKLADFAIGPMDFARWPIRRTVIESIDGFAAPSNYIKNFVLNQLPELNSRPFDVIYNPSIVPDINANESQRRNQQALLYASGPNFLKGPQIALQAVRELLNEGKEVSLSMIGVKGIPWIENLAKHLDLEKHVEMLPRLARSELCIKMANSDLVLLPSIIPEGQSRIAIESNRYGIPIVVSNAGGTSEAIIDGVTGIVAEPSAQAFANAISTAMTIHWSREMIRGTTKRFDPVTITSDFIRFLESFL